MTERACILVVDDEEAIRIFVAEELSLAGYTALTAASGEEALALLEEESVDLVLLDLKMGGMDGIDAMSRMLGKNHRLPIILNTAYSSYKDDFRAWSADAYVVKSSNLTPLKNAIREVLASREATA